MKKCIVLLVLLAAFPASATIAQVQSNAAWNCSNLQGQSVICTVTTKQPTGGGNLLAIWTFWQAPNGSGGVYPYSAAVSDQWGNDSFYSAVGPTLQLAASTPTTAQIFYAKNIHTSGQNNEVVTVKYNCLYSQGPPPTGNPACTLNPSIALAGVVAVEYSGLDQNYPLDSVSAGYSYTKGSLLDSGAAVPANANLLVFGAGITDSTSSLSTGNGFSVIQKATYPPFSAITEQNTNPITGNNVLQRATAANATTPVGNWLMQMAVFRDASWTVAGPWTPVRFDQVLNASQFPGADCGQSINAAEAYLGAAPGEIQVGNACAAATWSPVTISNNYHTLRFTAQGPFTVKTILLSGGFDTLIGPAYVTEVGSATQTIGNVIALSGNDGRVENLTIDGSAAQDNNTTGTQVDDIIVTGSRNWVVNNRIVATQGHGITVMGTATSGYGGGPGGDRNHVVGNKVFNCNAKSVNACIAVGNQVDSAGSFANYNEIIGNFVDGGTGSGDCIFVTAGLDSKPLSNGTMAKFNSVVGNTVRNCGDTSVEIGEGTFHAIAENNVVDVFNNGIMARDAIDPLIKGNSVYLERTALGSGISLVFTNNLLAGPDGRVVMEGNTAKGYIPINQYGNGSCFYSSLGGVHIKDNDCEFTAGSGLVMSIIDTNGTATLMTYQPLDLQAGDSITITGSNSNYYDGTYPLLSASDSSNTYTFSHVSGSPANTGTVSLINPAVSNLQASGINVALGPAMISNNRVKGVNVCINLASSSPLTDVTVADNWCNQVGYGISLLGDTLSHASLAGNYFSQVVHYGVYDNYEKASNSFASGNMFDPEGWGGAWSYGALTGFTTGNNLSVSGN